MNSASVGIYDSGLGGLTALRGIVKFLPNEDIIYFGDTGRVPYGSKANETIKRYSRQSVKFLKSHGVKIILVACGTVSSVAIDDLRNAFSDIPVIGVVESSCRKAVAIAEDTGSREIGVIATNATISKGAYLKNIAQYGNFNVISKACPMFVPLVENGYISKDNKVLRLIAEEYLAEIRPRNLSALILGCTHYPMIAETIDDVINAGKSGEKTVLIDSGYESALELKNEIQRRGIANSANHIGGIKIYVTDETVNFVKTAADFLGFDIGKNITKIDIDTE